MRTLLERSNLSNAILEGTKMSLSEAQQIILQNTNVQRANLEGADWSHSTLSRSTFDKCEMMEWRAIGADMKATKYISCHMNQCNLSECKLDETMFQSTDLTGAMLRKCIITVFLKLINYSPYSSNSL